MHHKGITKHNSYDDKLLHVSLKAKPDTDFKIVFDVKRTSSMRRREVRGIILLWVRILAESDRTFSEALKMSMLHVATSAWVTATA